MAGYIGTQAVSVNTTSATISDDLAVGDDATIAGTLGINTTSPSNDVEIITSADAKGLTIKNAGNVRPYLNFDSNRTGAGNTLSQLNFKWNGADVARINAVAGADTTNKDDGVLVFFTAAAGSPTEAMRIASTGLVTVADGLTLTDGNLVVAAGHGVDFSAQTASSASGASTSSEILDHYEEGTWTPVINGSTTTGSGTYGSQSATYTKIGRVVTFEFAITWTDHTGAGSLQVGGFPFGAGSQTYYTIQLEGVSLLSNYIAPAARVESSGSISLLIQSPVAGGNRAAIAMDTAGSINGGGTYQV